MQVPPAPAWSPGPIPPTAEGAAVHVWRVDLSPPPLVIKAYRALMEPQELTRADRFVFEHLTRRNIAGQGALRVLLGRYLRRPPQDVRFVAGPHGKPYLKPPAGDLQFNVSNSGNLALIAFTLGCEVGVDLEEKRGMTYGPEVARRHFSPAENAQLPPQEGPLWTTCFFNCWTRKEAFIKVTGEGLHRHLDSFEVSLLPEDEPRLLRVDDDHEPWRRFTLRTFNPGEGYAAALIFEAPPRAVRLYDFTHPMG